MTTALVDVPLSYAESVLVELGALGYSIEYLFNKAGLHVPATAYQTMDLQLPASEFIKLYSYCYRLLEAETSRRPDGNHLDEQAFEMMCYCLICCENLEGVIDRVSVFNRVLGPLGSHYELHKTDQAARFTLDLRRRTRNNASLLVCLATMNVLHQLFAWLIGKPLRLHEVSVRSPSPGRPNHMAESLGAPLKYNQPEDSFSFSPDYLEHRIVKGHNELQAVIHYFSFDIAYSGSSEGTLTERINMMILSCLQRKSPIPSSEAIAQLYGMSASSLRRRLRIEGTHFTKIRAACLMDYAEYLLNETRFKIDDIAAQLGFSDDRAFRRAFKQWRGLSPSGFRRQ